MDASILLCSWVLVSHEPVNAIEHGYTYVTLSLRLRLARRVIVSSGLLFESSLLSSIARRINSSSSYAASRLFIVDRRLGLEAPSLLRDFGSLERREVSLEEAREDGAGEGACNGVGVGACTGAGADAGAGAGGAGGGGGGVGEVTGATGR